MCRRACLDHPDPAHRAAPVEQVIAHSGSSFFSGSGELFYAIKESAQVNLVKKIVMRPVASLVPYASNSRTHTPAQIDLIARSIEAFGFTTDPGRWREWHRSRARAAQGCAKDRPDRSPDDRAFVAHARRKAGVHHR
jgi:hypothetical protein